jgi:hypothetical protein
VFTCSRTSFWSFIFITTDNAAEKIDAATDHAADATAKAAAETEATARKALAC